MTRMQKQTAVYWGRGSEETGGRDYDDHGQPLFASPIEITCRFVQKSEQYIDPQGNPQMSRAVVYCSHDVQVGGMLMLGEEADVLYPDDAKRNEGAWEIMQRQQLLKLNCRDYIWKVLL